MIVCPDNIRNYITKFINSDWMFERNFISEDQCLDTNTPKMVKHEKWGQEYKIKDLKDKLEPARFLLEDMTVQEAMQDIKNTFFDQYPVIQRKLPGKLVGMITTQLLMKKLADRKVTPEDKISKVMTRDFRNMSSEMPISELSRVLERQNFVFVDSTYIVSSYDVLEFMSKKLG